MPKRKSTLVYECPECPTLGKVFTLDSLNDHYRESHSGISSFKCSVCKLIFNHKTSLIRHITYEHADSEEGNSSGSLPCSSSDGASTSHSRRPPAVEVVDQAAGDPCSTGDHPDSDNSLEESVNPFPVKNVCSSGAEVVMELRSTARLTGAAIQRFQDGYRKLYDVQTNNIKNQIFTSLRAKGLSSEEAISLLSDVKTDDPFEELRTTEQQLNYFETNYGLVKPQSLFLDTRIDYRLNPKTCEYVATQVTESCQYISITETLKLILSNKKNQRSYLEEQVSQQGVYRSFADGTDFKTNPLMMKHGCDVLQIGLFYDDLEVAAALGSKTIIHKLGVFFFQILNGPAHLSSKLESIHLLALAYAEDMKKSGAYKKVLFKFVQEMKKLGSDKGVETLINGSPFIIRAVLVVLSADTLAAHELLGFLSPSARHFCRICMISRADFRLDGNTEAAKRTPEEHDVQVELVKQQPRMSTQYGVKDECVLNQLPYFHCVSGSVFDAFHDLLEGVIPIVLKLVLRNLICIRKLLTVTEFNAKLASFCYGIPDARNKPSPNFVKEMLTSHKKLKQTGTQMWCLMRIFPFLVADKVPDGDEHMEMVFITQDITKIAFSFEVVDQDLNAYDNLVYRLLEMFKRLFVDTINQENELVNEGDENELGGVGEHGVEIEDEELGFDDEEALDDGEEDVNLPPTTKKKSMRVHLFNKLHHLKHYSDQIREKGPIVRLWCAKYEASLKVFRQYAAICCNFKNPPLTMAQMYQLSNIGTITSSSDSDMSLEFAPGNEMTIEQSNHSDTLLEAGILKFVSTYKAIVNGEEYRPGLFISFLQSNTAAPQFSVISEIYVVDGSSVYFLLMPWNVHGLSPKFNAYRVSPNEMCNPLLKNIQSLENFRPIAPWKTSNGDTYLSPRTQLL